MYSQKADKENLSLTDKIKSEAALQTAVFSGRLPLVKVFNFFQHVSYDWSKCYGFVN